MKIQTQNQAGILPGVAQTNWANVLSELAASFDFKSLDKVEPEGDQGFKFGFVTCAGVAISGSITVGATWAELEHVDPDPDKSSRYISLLMPRIQNEFKQMFAA